MKRNSKPDPQLSDLARDIHVSQTHDDDPHNEWPKYVDRPFFVRLSSWNAWQSALKLSSDVICDNKFWRE